MEGAGKEEGMNCRQRLEGRIRGREVRGQRGSGGEEGRGMEGKRGRRGVGRGGGKSKGWERGIICVHAYINMYLYKYRRLGGVKLWVIHPSVAASSFSGSVYAYPFPTLMPMGWGAVFYMSGKDFGQLLLLCAAGLFGIARTLTFC